MHLGQPWLSSSKTSSSVCELPSRLRFIFISLRASYQCNLGSTCWSSLWEFFLWLFFQGTSVYPSSHQPIFANLNRSGRRRASLWINYHLYFHIFYPTGDCDAALSDARTAKNLDPTYIKAIATGEFKGERRQLNCCCSKYLYDVTVYQQDA